MAVLSASGCATGGVIAPLDDAELPVETTPTPYPTAIESVMVPSSIESGTSQAVVVGTAVDSESAARASTAPGRNAASPVIPQATVEKPQVARPASTAGATPAADDPDSTTSTLGTTDEHVQPVANAAELRLAQASGTAASSSETLPPTKAPTADAVSSPLQSAVSAVDQLPATHTSSVPAATGTSVAPLVSSPEDRLAAIAHERDVLIAMLEEDLHHRRAAAGAPTDSQLPRLEQQLRLLYAAAARPDDAARAVDSLTQAERDAYKHLMFGLSTWLADDQPQRAALRSAHVLRSLRAAQGELTAAAKLDLANLAFCERVESFGWYTEFARNNFLPKQQVIVYVEINNFTAREKGPRSFETELQGSYQIFDARGNIVAERKLPLDREVCRNLRRDYFLAYPIYIPDTIDPGRYRLELTIEDLKAGEQYQGRKFGEGSIEFTVRS
jgi:hypothetical protein